MSKKSKKLKKRGKARDDDPGAPPRGKAAMTSDTARAEEHRNLRDGAAVIPPVTEAMMVHAAHEAAVLAGEVAHHAAAPEQPTAEAAGSGAFDGEEPAKGTGPTGEASIADAVDPAVLPAEEAAEETPPAPADALSRFNNKVFEMVRANAASTTAHFAALVQARSVPEALSLNADHLRRQVDILTSQGRELAALAERVALDALQPFKGPTGR